MNQTELIAAALHAVPDLPHWVDVRGLLLSGQCRVFGGDGGFVVRSEAKDGQLVGVAGRPAASDFKLALKDFGECELMCRPEDASHVAEHLPDWEREGVVVFELEDPAQLASPTDAVRLLTLEDSLEHLPGELREEIDGARREREVFAAFADGVAASFGYSYWETETHCDISIDTLEELRRRGLARLAVSELIRRRLERGVTPVWGAMASNVASQELAVTLGYVASAEMVLFANA